MISGLPVARGQYIKENFYKNNLQVWLLFSDSKE